MTLIEELEREAFDQEAQGRPYTATLLRRAAEALAPTMEPECTCQPMSEPCAVCRADMAETR